MLPSLALNVIFRLCLDTSCSDCWRWRCVRWREPVWWKEPGNQIQLVFLRTMYFRIACYRQIRVFLLDLFEATMSLYRRDAGYGSSTIWKKTNKTTPIYCEDNQSNVMFTLFKISLEARISTSRMHGFLGQVGKTSPLFQTNSPLKIQSNKLIAPFWPRKMSHF